MDNPNNEQFNRRFSWLLVGIVFVALAIGVGFAYFNPIVKKSFTRKDNFHPAGPLPTPPAWVKEIPAKPEWWKAVVVTNYDEALTTASKIARKEEMEKVIKDKVRMGQSPIKERRELIKFLTLWKASPRVSPGDQSFLFYDMAHNYEELGEVKMAARLYLENAEKSRGRYSLYALALQYERTGDKEAALQIYNFMFNSFKKGDMDHWLGSLGKGRLAGVTNGCILRKPDWWSEYESAPDWWSEVNVTLPKITCFWDGVHFISHNWNWDHDNAKKRVKAFTMLTGLVPTTAVDRKFALSSIGLAYSTMGDHHRAIEAQWQIPEHLSGGPFESTNVLNFIAREFDELGETNNAQRIRDVIPCFSRDPEN